jgi:hypothetical protein
MEQLKQKTILSNALVCVVNNIYIHFFLTSMVKKKVIFYIVKQII